MLSCENYRVIQLADTKIDFLQLYQLDPCFYPALLESVTTDHSSKQSETAFDILFFDPQDSLYLDPQQQIFINNVFAV